MTHADLPDGGRLAHAIIDRLLPTAQQKAALAGADALEGDLWIDPGQALYLLQGSNTTAQQDGNWRITVDGDDLVIETRAAGTWTTVARFQP